ncbi:hypothetical protein VitviT2T_004170 [Vitis vinifera]|uniref:Uncharacterized protein n=1 Tax=Vitis vinifera TaxID=29760 RepID=A0ABY9BNN7_VITVI|nr:hypothetical protein VitviT2T_004170 [Vitis vinifera]
MGCIIFRHMKACSLSEDSVFAYGMFITKIVKYFNMNLRNETDGAKAVADHPSQISRNEAKASNNLNDQIRSLGTRLEEMALSNERRLTSLEQRIDGFQEEFKLGMQVIRAQHDELMEFLRG